MRQRSENCEEKGDGNCRKNLLCVTIKALKRRLTVQLVKQAKKPISLKEGYRELILRGAKWWISYGRSDKGDLALKLASMSK
jgi:hypothetical protein